jgi:hypothetical protein
MRPGTTAPVGERREALLLSSRERARRGAKDEATALDDVHAPRAAGRALTLRLAEASVSHSLADTLGVRPEQVSRRCGGDERCPARAGVSALERPVGNRAITTPAHLPLIIP